MLLRLPFIFKNYRSFIALSLFCPKILIVAITSSDIHGYSMPFCPKHCILPPAYSGQPAPTLYPTLSFDSDYDVSCPSSSSGRPPVDGVHRQRCRVHHPRQLLILPQSLSTVKPDFYSLSLSKLYSPRGWIPLRRGGATVLPSRKIAIRASRNVSKGVSLIFRAPDFERSTRLQRSVVASYQQLNIEKGNRDYPHEGYTTSVVIPNHLQVQNVDCSHLSFGSFGPKPALPTESNFGELRNESNVLSVGILNSRSSTNAGTYAPYSASQREEVKPENAEVVHSNQYTYPPNTRWCDDAQRLNAPFCRAISQMQTLASFSNVVLNNGHS